jgi:hypothetical protein
LDHAEAAECAEVINHAVDARGMTRADHNLLENRQSRLWVLRLILSWSTLWLFSTISA